MQKYMRPFKKDLSKCLMKYFIILFFMSAISLCQGSTKTITQSFDNIILDDYKDYDFIDYRYAGSVFISYNMQFKCQTICIFGTHLSDKCNNTHDEEWIHQISFTEGNKIGSLFIPFLTGCKNKNVCRRFVRMSCPLPQYCTMYYEIIHHWNA
jgi:hypothetical protein